MRRGRRRKRPPYKTIGLVALMVMVLQLVGCVHRLSWHADVTPKYVNLTSPKNPAAQSITPSTVIDATSVTTEFNTLFETLTSMT
jgi:hypothetical protein